MSLNPHVGPLTTSVCRAAFWFSNDIRKCVFSAKEELRDGGSWQEKEGGQSGERKKSKAQDEEQWKGRCSKVPVVSQLRVHALITDVAWGEWRTNSGSWARWGLLIMRFKLTFHPKPLWASCLLLLTPHCCRPPLKFVLDSHDKTRKEILAETRICELCFLCLSVFRPSNWITNPKQSPEDTNT